MPLIYITWDFYFRCTAWKKIVSGISSFQDRVSTRISCLLSKTNPECKTRWHSTGDGHLSYSTLFPYDKSCMSPYINSANPHTHNPTSLLGQMPFTYLGLWLSTSCPSGHDCDRFKRRLNSSSGLFSYRQRFVYANCTLWGPCSPFSCAPIKLHKSK